jgi:uncharacterized repeat protein (TIGR03806 family)
MTRCRPRSSVFAAAVCAAAALATACADIETAPEPAPACVPKDGPLPFEKLSDYCFFEDPMRDLVAADGILSYDVAAALWSDHAAKQRLIVLPKGQKVVFDKDEDWQFPVGTIIVKTFSFYDDFRDLDTARRILETRLLILGESGWTGEVYRWNDEQTDAVRTVAGERVDVSYIDESGESAAEEYVIPNTNQCKSCHERNDTTTLLGPITHQMNRPVQIAGESRNQLEYLAERGLFDAALPPVETLPAFPDPFGSGPLEDRARAYLHANCAHCHRPGGGGGPSGLVLLAWEKDLGKNGVCKEPAAAGAGTGGHHFDIVPGHPEDSILIFRISSSDPSIKMPELPNRIPDKKGVELATEWISSMAPKSCE